MARLIIRHFKNSFFVNVFGSIHFVFHVCGLNILISYSFKYYWLRQSAIKKLLVVSNLKWIARRRAFSSSSINLEISWPYGRGQKEQCSDRSLVLTDLTRFSLIWYQKSLKLKKISFVRETINWFLLNFIDSEIYFLYDSVTMNAQFFNFCTSKFAWIAVFRKNSTTSKLKFKVQNRLNHKLFHRQSLNLFVWCVFSSFGSVKDESPLGWKKTILK